MASESSSSRRVNSSSFLALWCSLPSSPWSSCSRQVVALIQLLSLSENGPITVTGDLLPAFEGDTATDAGAGLAAPILEGESFDGTAVVVEPGSPTLLVFLAHWCPHCQAEVPDLVEWAESLGSARSERCRGGDKLRRLIVQITHLLNGCCVSVGHSGSSPTMR